MGRPGALTLCAAAGALAGARVWLFVTPARALRWSTRSARATRSAAAGPADDLASSLARAVRSVGVRIPFRATCLEQGLALLMLLTIARIPARLIVGVSRAKETFRAHAWVECRGRVVLGAAGVEEFSPLVHADE